MNMHAIRIHQPGGPEVLRHEQTAVPQPKAGEALVRIHAAGVNFIDIYHRTGFYKLPLPITPGMEGAGVLEAVGEGVTEVKPGDRVAYAMHIGAYAEYATVPAWQLVPVPSEVSFETAAAVMLQGMTAHYLSKSLFPLGNQHTCLIHAAAGGVGMLLVQMAKLAGARVFGTVSKPEKAALARTAGADEVILYTEQDFESEVRRFTNGKGVQVVYDSVGKDTFEKSLNCLAPRGYMVFFGQSSGPVPPVDPLRLSAKGSLFMTRCSLAHYAASREEVLWRAGELFERIVTKQLQVRVHQQFPLAAAAEAQRLLESRRSSGKLLLTP